jgi:LDH2 family malate/lactate/ureidoglycolate dehydrogenase
MTDELNESFQLVALDVVREFSTRLVSKHGVPEKDAALLVDTLIKAEQWGHSSHGLLRLSWYLERLRNGAIKANANPTFAVDSGPLLVIDGDDALGQVLADMAADEAIKRSKQFGVCAIGVRNSNHFGTAMYFTRKIAGNNCVAILTTNASPSMAPWGGAQKVLGNNPWSIAAPFRDSVVALDMANTVVARGKLYAAQQRGDDIPEDWAITKDGRRTTNAAEGIAGVILPMGGHKGYAISFMMDVLSGALTGAGVGTDVHGPYEPKARSNCGHLLIVIDIEKMTDSDDFQSRIEKLVGEVRSAPLAEGFSKVFYPGEIEDLKEAEALVEAKIKVYDSTKEILNAFGKPFGLTL